MNTFGRFFRLTTFGESHGAAIGGIIDGVPGNFPLNVTAIQKELDRRRPGQNTLGSTRNESDKVQILSGLFEGRTLGTPIGFIIPNNDAKSSDYEQLRDVYRPSHADYTYWVKYNHRDHRGGGRASARETASRIVAGAVARQFLETMGITVSAYTSRIGKIHLDTPYQQLNLDKVYSVITRCPDTKTAKQMEQTIAQAREDGDTIGGTVSCVIRGLCRGIGEPVFGKLQAMLAQAMMSIPAAKGFEYGSGFAAAEGCGSTLADNFIPDSDGFTISSNHSGGIQGGISNGEDIYFNVAFKPAPTMMRDIITVDINGQPTTINPRGRHDTCVVPRAVAVVEAMASMTIFDAILTDNARSMNFNDL